MLSMTGYGRASDFVNGREITVEIRSVNHRYFDCTVKTGRQYGYLEDPIKKLVQTKVSRGKLDVGIQIDNTQSDDIEVVLNRRLFEAYLHSLQEMRDTYNLRDDISASVIARYPDVFTVVAHQADTNELTRDVIAVALNALDDFSRMREKEGAKMRDDIAGYTSQIESYVERISILAPQTVKAYREKLESRIRELLDGVSPDENRLLTEVAIFADRIAIDEELARLRSHIVQARSMLCSDESIGKKMDFLIQEFNREANTIGSKANDVEITKLVVEMKSVIEKMREQVQNIE